MKKPTYYLWRDDYSSPEEYTSMKEKYTRMGFRVVTFKDGPADRNIEEGIKALIKNHIADSCR